MPPRSYSSGQDGWTNDDLSVGSAEELVEKLTMKSAMKGSCSNRKSLRFSKHQDIFPIPHLDDLQDDEVAAIWYESGEYSDIKSAYQLTIFMIENGELKESDEHTGRGLEYRTQDGAWARYENKRDAYNAVLDEQDRQWKVDKDDFEAISSIYLVHSGKCAVAAAKRGSQDADEAKEICSDILKKRKVRRKKSKKSVCTSSQSVVSSTDSRDMLRVQSDSRRGQVRDDIEKQKLKAMSRTSTNRPIAVSAI